MDKYTAGIELSNACRQFYVTRLKAASNVKNRLGLSNGISSEEEECTENIGDETKHTYQDAGEASPSRQILGAKSAEQQKTTKHGKIESAMATLKYEMVKLMYEYKFELVNTEQLPFPSNGWQLYYFKALKYFGLRLEIFWFTLESYCISSW